VKKPTRIVVPSLGPAHWRALLADPYVQWKRGRSAWELAVSWESARDSETGIPPEVRAALKPISEFEQASLLLAIPEHRVALDTAKSPSQNDLWCVLRVRGGYASAAVEAKAGEDFDKTIAQWMSDGSRGKSRRLEFLCGVLELAESPPRELRYQLFHRTASAVLEARRWGMSTALMLVQSFAESPTSWEDYAGFGALLGCEVSRGRIVRVPLRRDPVLFLGWVDSPMADNEKGSAAV